jgi:hypothetical protein
MAKKLDSSAVPDVKRRLLVMQGGKCAICGHPMTARDVAVLDHDHSTGIVRGVLHNSCYGAEGRVKGKAHMGHKGVGAYTYLIALGKYLERHIKPQTNLIHPVHRSDDEKRLLKNKRARTARAKKKVISR